MVLPEPYVRQPSAKVGRDRAVKCGKRLTERSRRERVRRRRSVAQDRAQRSVRRLKCPGSVVQFAARVGVEAPSLPCVRMVDQNVSKSCDASGALPVRNDARDGAHSAAWQYARSKVIAPAASASRLGIATCPCM